MAYSRHGLLQNVLIGVNSTQVVPDVRSTRISLRLLCRQQNRKNGAAIVAHCNLAVMSVNDAMYNRQPEPSSRTPCRKKWIEYLVDLLSGDAGAHIAHLEAQRAATNGCIQP